MRDNLENTPFGQFIWFMGVIEDIEDPLKINRVRVRCIGFHSDNKSEVPTESLPWAPMVSSTANMSAPMLNQGDWVVGFFIDGRTAQQPVVLGSITGIPTQPADTARGFSDPDGIFPRSGQITYGTNSPLARGELGIPTGVEAQPSYYEPPAPSENTEAPSQQVAPATNTPSTADFNEHETALIEAAKKQGITTIPELAAFLANCKHETGNFRKLEENLSYSTDSVIRKTFGKYFKGVDTAPYIKNPPRLGSRVYANRNGNGNEASKEGYTYRGRGYLQITGKSNYAAVERACGINCVRSPDDLAKSIESAALSSAWWWKTNVSRSSRYNKPSPPNETDTYIIATGGIVNGKVPSNGQAERVKYFKEYLNKLKGTVDATDSVIETDPISGEITSVTQPNYKTPSRQTDEDAITYTKRTAAAGILTASGLTWNEPSSKYATEYPKNHVMETAGGHVLEFDDTEGSERIHIFHKTGSFIEIHPDGRIVMRSNGSMNQITYGDGNFYIRGNCNISATGDINLLSNKATNISTVGDVNWKVGGKFNLTSQGEAKIITSKLFLEGSEIRMNEGTAGIGAPTPVNELSVSASSAETLADGEGYTQNSRGVLDGSGEGSDETPYTTDTGGTTPTAGGSTDVKPTKIEWNGDLNVKISKYYKLKDLTKGIPIRGSRGISAADVVNNLTILAQVILDPLRDAGLRFNINDGLRDPNSATGKGNPKSDHITGCAIDLGPVGMSAYDQALKIHEIVGNRARQHLLEYTSKGAVGWNHIAIGGFGAKNPNGAKSSTPVATFMNHKNAHVPNKFKDYKNGRKG